MLVDGLVANLLNNAVHRPDDTAVVVDAQPGETLSYRELDLAARSTAAWLQEHCAPGDRVLLLNPLGVEFVRNLVGCLYAGMIPVAAPVPEDNDDHHLMRATGIAIDTDARQVLTDRRYLTEVHNWISQDGLSDLMCVATDDDPLGDPADWVPPHIGPNDPALLCYQDTSGADLDGTVISHGALGHSIDRIRAAFDLTPADRLGSWLPPDHYSGLIGVLTALATGCTVVLMPTADFHTDPGRWPELVSRHRVTVSGGPAHAFLQCVRAVGPERLALLDLSCWRHAYTASVPLEWEVLAGFARHFAPAGFEAGALRPVYCVPQAMFLVASGAAGRQPMVCAASARALEKNTLVPGVDNGTTHGTLLVSRGSVGDLDVRIVDPDTHRELPDQRIGEVWIRCAAWPHGRWQHGAGWVDLRVRTLANGEAGFLATDDLGAFADGELFIVGHRRDTLSVRGRNLYPHHIEREIRALSAAFAGHPGSVFSVTVPRQEIVVAQEIADTALDPAELRQLAGTVRTWLRSRVNARIGNVMFLRPGELHPLHNGSARRTLVRELFLAQALDPVYEELDGDVRRRYRAEKVRDDVRSAR